MRVLKAMALAGLATALVTIIPVAVSGSVQAQATVTSISRAGATDVSAQSRRERRAATRLRVERYQRLPPTAVRTCNAWYEQERRLSGTVIVPKMSCRWING
jgi:hypothetical protein